MKTFLMVSFLSALCGCADFELNPQGMSALQNYSDSLSTPPQQQKKLKQLDLTCMDDCRASGYQYDLCESKCSY